MGYRPSRKSTFILRAGGNTRHNAPEKKFFEEASIHHGESPIPIAKFLIECENVDALKALGKHLHHYCTADRVEVLFSIGELFLDMSSSGMWRQKWRQAAPVEDVRFRRA